MKMTYLILILSINFTTLSFAGDLRYCGFVPRNNHGEIKRSSKVLKDFQLLYPCPSTKKTTGTCNGWSKDHIIPLACGGCDSIENLQWLPNSIKTCVGSLCKDRFERSVYKTNFCA